MRKAAVTKPKKASKAPLAAAGKRRAAPPAKTKPAQTLHPPATTAILALPAECTLRDAAALQALLISTVSSTQSVTVDGGAVTRIDAAALQLLAAFARREQAAGRRVEWRSSSAELHKASDMLGLSGILQLPAKAGARA